MPDGGDIMQFRQEIIPGPETARDFRLALGQFSTGVTVVTAMTDTGAIGMTANSFSSVSMDPPLVMWCPAKSSKRYPHFANAKKFSIHVLGAEQRDLASRFARAGDNFASLDFETTEHGVPVLGSCLARFDCSLDQTHDAGDHAIIVGRVDKAVLSDGEALVFCQGQFGQFSGA